MENKRSNGLIVLCVLSALCIAYQAFSLFISLSSGPATDEQIKEQKIALLESQTPETLEASRWMIEDAERISKIQQENFTTMSALDGLGILVGLVAIILMFRLKKIGFHLYIVYTLISIFYWTYFFASVGLASMLIGFSIGIGILFVILYGLQAKKMT